MTSVTLSKTPDRYAIEAVGHAEGSVQACAAVSVLMYSILGYLSNVESVDIDEWDTADGFFSLKWSGDGVAHVMYEFGKIAFLQLEKSYGEYVAVKIKK
jgi:uncharacterized protein YsxB (DUF464 family)